MQSDEIGRNPSGLCTAEVRRREKAGAFVSRLEELANRATHYLET
jgi:hypothetical protein